MKKQKHKHRPTVKQRARRSLQRWLKLVRACSPTGSTGNVDPTLVSSSPAALSGRAASARQVRIARQQLRRTDPKSHAEVKLLARTKREVVRKLDGARVSWARKLWEGRREAEGKGTGDRQFFGALVPSVGSATKPPRKSRKWLRWGKPKGSTRTPSHKLGFSKYRHDHHPLHQRRKVSTSSRTGFYAYVRKAEKKREKKR